MMLEDTFYLYQDAVDFLKEPVYNMEIEVNKIGKAEILFIKGKKWQLENW